MFFKNLSTKIFRNQKIKLFRFNGKNRYFFDHSKFEKERNEFKNILKFNKDNKNIDYLPYGLSLTLCGLIGLNLYRNYKKNFNYIKDDELKNKIRQNKIKKLQILDEKEIIIEPKDENIYYRMKIPNFKYFEKKYDLNNLDIEFHHSGDFKILNQILVSSLFFGLFIYFMRRNTGGMNGIFQFSKNNQIKVQENIKIRFKDVIGQDHSIKLLNEFLLMLNDFDKYKKIGAKIPKGALLTGPPGTGKTLLAKALAGESNLPFVSLSGSDLNAMFVGVGAMKVKNLFSEAQKKAKEFGGCIIFIDEIDAIGQKRGMSGINVNSERENTLNQLLTEMDGFTEIENIMVLAATNRPEILDDALLRPGRFDRKINIGLPNIKERENLFRYYFDKLAINLKKKELDDLIHSSAILTNGFSGADISNVCNESAIISVRENNSIIDDVMVKKAIDYVFLGSEKDNFLKEKDEEIIAFHEAGHAIVSYILDYFPNPIKVTIVPREKGVLGFSQSLDNDDIFITKKKIEQQICVLMSGRIAEEIFCGDVTNGASNDIEKASLLVRNYLNILCMGNLNRFLQVKENEGSFNQNIGNNLKDEMDKESIEIMNKLYTKTYNLIDQNKDKIKLLKTKLMEKKTIYANEIDDIMNIDVKKN